MRDELLLGTMLHMEPASLRPPSPRFERDYDHVVVLRGVSWTHYKSLLEARGEKPQPRFAYLDGVLEIMTTSTRHEIDKKLIARLVEAFAEVADVPLDGVGNATFNEKAEEAGLEPDECYFIGPHKEAPDIAIEVVYTSGGVDKLEIYRRLGVREVWFWIEGRFWLYALVRGKYHEVRQSPSLPELDLDEVARTVVACNEGQQTPMVRAYREAVAARLSGGTRPNS
jgi:Uma2 family endonuclease